MTTIELSKQVIDALRLPKCKQYFLCDSRNVISVDKSKGLRLDRFISRQIEKILLYSEPESWSYCPTSLNSAQVASRPDGIEKLEVSRLCFDGSEFWKKNRKAPNRESANVSAN